MLNQVTFYYPYSNTLMICDEVLMSKHKLQTLCVRTHTLASVRSCMLACGYLLKR